MAQISFDNHMIIGLVAGHSRELLLHYQIFSPIQPLLILLWWDFYYLDTKHEGTENSKLQNCTLSFGIKFTIKEEINKLEN